jgi:hypothetical protein
VSGEGGRWLGGGVDLQLPTVEHMQFCREIEWLASQPVRPKVDGGVQRCEAAVKAQVKRAGGGELYKGHHK